MEETALQILCREKYGIDFEKKITQILPYFWTITIFTQDQKDIFLNYCYVLFSQLTPINDQFIDFCVFIENRLSYTGQVLSLEKLLNDNFDNTQRRITIECLDALPIEGIDIYLDLEIDPSENDFYLDSETNPNPISLFLDGENPQENNFNFNVNVPADIAQSDLIIRALLDIYVVSGQNYQIIRL